MSINLKLTDLHPPNLGSSLLTRRLEVLNEISEKNTLRFGQGYETAQFTNRKQALINRLKARSKTRESFAKATEVVGRQRLLLSVYIDHLGQSNATWLPELDRQTILSLLGDKDFNWPIGRRRQATLLFFQHFDRIKDIAYLCDRLQKAYISEDKSIFGKANKLHKNRELVFHSKGPEIIASKRNSKENLSSLMQRFGIPKNGRFAERLRKTVLLNAVKDIPYGKASKVFEMIEDRREDFGPDNLRMGAAALKIILERVEKEGKGQWRGEWNKWITRFGCDPRFGRATAQSAKWWGWATESQMRLAQQGMTKLTLGFFINFLRQSMQGSDKAAQFKVRQRFLMALFEAGKIVEARLVLRDNTMRNLDPKYRSSSSVAKLIGGQDLTSIICLKCIQDIYIIEGTHSFALRMFHRNFPIRQFWESPNSEYKDSELRVSKNQCPVFLRHDPGGKWIDNFFFALRSEFHIEWDDVRI